MVGVEMGQHHRIDVLRRVSEGRKPPEHAAAALPAHPKRYIGG